MAKKQRTYNGPPRSPMIRCSVCYGAVHESKFYNHVATSCGAASKKKKK